MDVYQEHLDEEVGKFTSKKQTLEIKNEEESSGIGSERTNSPPVDFFES